MFLENVQRIVKGISQKSFKALQRMARNFQGICQQIFQKCFLSHSSKFCQGSKEKSEEIFGEWVSRSFSEKWTNFFPDP